LQFVRHELIFRHLERFGYIRCNITLSFLINSAGRYIFSASCVYSDTLCIIRCIQSESAIM